VESDWQSGAFADVEMDLWHQNRGVLASALGDSEWHGVAEAFEIVESLRGRRWPPGKQADAIQSLDTGLHTLGRIAGTEQYWWAQRFTDE
jgi:hypothetical protein